MINEWEDTRTYATQNALEKILEKKNLKRLQPLIVRAPNGRWTAIFAKSFLDANNINFMYVIDNGFKVLG